MPVFSIVFAVTFGALADSLLGRSQTRCWGRSQTRCWGAHRLAVGRSQVCCWEQYTTQRRSRPKGEAIHSTLNTKHRRRHKPP